MSFLQDYLVSSRWEETGEWKLKASRKHFRPIQRDLSQSNGEPVTVFVFDYTDKSPEEVGKAIKTDV